MNCCFFIGHHDAGNELLPLLIETVERHITEYGVTDFFVGHYGQFDSMAAQAVKIAKKRHPEVTLFWCYHTTRQSAPLKSRMGLTPPIIRGRKSVFQSALPSSRLISAWSTTANI